MNDGKLPISHLLRPDAQRGVLPDVAGVLLALAVLVAQGVCWPHTGVISPDLLGLGRLLCPDLHTPWAQCTLITLGLSYRKLVAALSFSQSWVTLYSSLVTSPTACYTWPVTAFPPIRLDNTDTDHWTHDVLAWVSPRDWRRWELSGGQGREGVHSYTDGCPVLRTVQCKRKVLLYLKYFSFEFMCNCSKHFTYSLVKDKHKKI